MGNKGDATKQRIKLSAQMIFSKKGYKETTMKDICEATDATDNKFYSKMEQGVPAQKILEEILVFHKM